MNKIIISLLFALSCNKINYEVVNHIKDIDDKYQIVNEKINLFNISNRIQEIDSVTFYSKLKNESENISIISKKFSINEKISTHIEKKDSTIFVPNADTMYMFTNNKYEKYVYLGYIHGNTFLRFYEFEDDGIIIINEKGLKKIKESASYSLFLTPNLLIKTYSKNPFLMDSFTTKIYLIYNTEQVEVLSYSSEWFTAFPFYNSGFIYAISIDKVNKRKFYFNINVKHLNL